MNNTPTDQIAARFLLAAEALLRQTPDPAFAGDTPSVRFVSGGPLRRDAASLLEATEETDLVHLAFAPGHEQLGPQGITILARRGPSVHRWPDGVLWAPADGGPLLIIPGNVATICFAYDGLALIPLPDRPTRALGDGIARASRRLRHAARRVTEDQLAALGCPRAGKAA